MQMQNLLQTLVVPAVLMTALAGCNEPGADLGRDEGSSERPTFRELVSNDVTLNSATLNDWKLNGSLLGLGETLTSSTSTESITLRRWDFGIFMPGFVLTTKGIGGRGFALRDLDPDSPYYDYIYTSRDLEGLTMEYEISKNGVVEQATVRVEWADQRWDALDREYAAYWLFKSTPEGEEPLCTDSLGNDVPALVLEGLWDPASGAKSQPSHSITFACEDGVLAKCARLGYAPWDESTDLRPYHQACTRMLRADYCGNGIPHTVSGTMIHVLDNLGIQLEAPDDYLVEAEWGPSGATCLNPSNTRIDGQKVACSLPACGEPFASGGLIQSGKLEN